MNPADKVRLELLEDFRRSTVERLEKISLAWFQIEKVPGDTATGEELVRQLHTLKGEAKMMGFADVSLVAHRTEELVLHAQQLDFAVPETFGDLVLAATDAVSLLIHKKAGTSQATVDLAVLFDRLDAVLEGSSVGEGVRRPHAAAPAPLQIAPAAQRPEERVAPEQFLRVHRDVIGAFSEAASESAIGHARYEQTVAELRELSTKLAELFGSLETMQGDSAGGAGADGFSPAVSALAWSSVDQLAALHKQLHGLLVDLRDQIYEGSAGAHELERLARQLRLVPVGGLLNKYVRAVRDLCSEHGKLAGVDVEDGAVALDKVVVDRIAEPLLHLVRNSVDHGLETPEERQAKDKPQSGRIVLSARQQGAHVVIAVEDDGRGIDVAAVRERAVNLGLLSQEGAAAQSDEELMGLVFRPGFSTRTVVTETSGRGVGLDVVKREVDLLGGTVRAHSEAGRGTRFEIMVPVSVALTRVLVVRAGDRIYAIPTSAVEGVLAVHEDDIEMAHNRRVVRHRGEPVILVELTGLLQEGEAESKETRAVVVRHEDGKAAILVSEARSDLEVIIKPLGGVLEASHLFTGACTLGQGALALVFNPSELVTLARGEAPRIKPAAASRDATRAKRILLAEDSPITRAMVARVLRALGYEVREAEDGAQALEHFKAETFDLVLTDMEMPHMNGIDLIRAIRAERRQSDVPVIVLSTRGSDEDKRRGVEAGADAYLVKTEFSEEALRDVIARRLGC